MRCAPCFQINLEATGASHLCDYVFHGIPSRELLPVLFGVEDEVATGLGDVAAGAPAPAPALAAA